MKKTSIIMIILFSCTAVLFLNGCALLSAFSSREPLQIPGDAAGSAGTADTEMDESPEPLKLPALGGAVLAGESFDDPLVNGKLSYTVHASQVLQDTGEAHLTKEEFLEPHNIYSTWEMGEKYRGLSDLIDENGKIVETHRLVMLDFTIRNDSALGDVKKTEFNINNLSLFGLVKEEPLTHYPVAYFGEAGKIAGSDQPLHYVLAQGMEMRTKIGFFVLKEDIEDKSLIGIVGLNSENQTLFDVGI